MDTKAFKAVLFGYEEDSKSYRFYNAATKKVIEKRETDFLENLVEEVSEAANESVTILKLKGQA